MAYYCGECAVWRGSSDVNRYGERYCGYSKRYEKSDQNIYGCRGFIYAGRAIITKVCEILQIPNEQFFDSYDKAKEEYVVPNHMCWLIEYASVGPDIADAISNDPDKQSVAEEILAKYIIPANDLCISKQFKEATNHYKAMVTMLKDKYHIQAA